MYGTGDSTWTVVSGQAPTSQGLNAQTGAFDGVAQAAATYDFTLRVTDAAGAEVEKTFQVLVNRFPAILTEALPIAAAGRPYSTTLLGKGGTPALLWSTAEGPLPDGVTLDEATGVIAGNPTRVGLFAFDSFYADSCGAVATWPLSITVAGGLDLFGKGAKGEAWVDAEDGMSAVHHLELLAGSLLGFSVKVKGGGVFRADVRLLDSEERPLEIAGYTKVKAKSVSGRRIPIPATGRYFLVVTPAEEFRGTVLVKVKAKAPSKWKEVGEIAGPGGTLTVFFAALEGARVTIKVKPAKRSAALPTIESLLSPTGAELLSPEDLRAKGKSAKLKVARPLEGGDHTVSFGVREGSAGDISYSIKLKRPRGYPFSMEDVPTRTGE
jgi:hypothetical protein